MASEISPERTRSAAAFVGRERELSELRAGLDDVSAGHGRLFLISGEPGIGKTRLAEKISNDASALGMRVSWGRCWESGGAPAYWPFIQILRVCVEDVNRDHLKALLSSGASEIARLIPEIKLSLPSLEEPKTATDSESARFLLFDAVATLLKNVARQGPLVIVLDDLHDADQPSLQMLRFVARVTKDSRILIIGTYRDAEVRRSPELGKLIGDLIREGRPVSLAGLSQAEVGEFIERSSAKKADDKLVADLYHATDGNPLFVEGVVRLLAAEGKLERPGFDGGGFKIPDGVRESIRRQLAALSDEAKSLLSIASVIGNEFDARLLERVSGRSPDQLIEQIDEAVRIGVLRTGAPGLLRQQFSHALIRNVLHDDMAANRRIELHRTIGTEIEETCKDDLQPHMAALAHHFRRAGNTEKAIDYSIRAGRAAYTLFAFEEAGAHWRVALELMDEHRGADRKRRAGLLLLLGDDLISGGPKAVEYLETAAPLFEELGDDRAACDAHLRLVTYLTTNILGTLDMRRAMPHFKKAEALLDKQPESYRHAQFYIAMANAYGWTIRIGDGLAAAKRAMEISERPDTQDQLQRRLPQISGMRSEIRRDTYWSVAASLSSVFLVRSGSVTEGLRLADQARQRADPINNATVGSGVAANGGSNYMQLWSPRNAQDWFTSELAKPHTARALVRRVVPSAPPPYDNIPLNLHHLLVITCIETGELTKAQAYLGEAGVTHKPPELLFFEGEWELAGNGMNAEFEQSRTAGNRLAELFCALGLARLHRFTGERALALQYLQRALDISVDGGDLLSELTTRSTLATITADAGDAGEALPHLERCRQIIGAGENWLGLAGKIECAEAVVAAAQSEYSAAEAYFERAIVTFQRYCLPWEEADTFQYWGSALLAAGERARAIEKFDAAIEIYHRHGASARFIEYVMVDKMRLPEPPTETPSDEHRGSVEDSIFRCEGDYWTVVYEGRTSRLKDAKGLQYMAYLLAHPGEEIRALDLVTRIGGGGEETVEKASAEDLARSHTVAGNLGHAGEMLDAQAKADYQRRLTELEDELEEARELGNDERIAKAEDEKEAVAREIRRAVGLGGRDRRAASSAERARVAVTRAIRLALDRISEQNRDLGRLLSTTIKTGAVCSYVPDDRFPISWRL